MGVLLRQSEYMCLQHIPRVAVKQKSKCLLLIEGCSFSFDCREDGQIVILFHDIWYRGWPLFFVKLQIQYVYSSSHKFKYNTI